MIAVDTNILVYAHRRDSLFHDRAKASLASLATSKGTWSIPWPCLHEFLTIVTHPRIYKPCSTLKEACNQVDYWLESPSLTILGEGPQYWQNLRELLQVSQITGPQIHDAKIAAICLQNNVHTLWTCDRDFNRIPSLKVINPLVVID